MAPLNYVCALENLEQDRINLLKLRWRQHAQMQEMQAYIFGSDQ